MKVKAADYLASLPFAERAKAKKALADAHGRPLSSIYKWLSRGAHPADAKTIAITEAWSGYKVTRFEERPDVWKLDELIESLQRMGYTIDGPVTRVNDQTPLKSIVGVE